ncbi:hypothetical protein MPRF_08750 [Mycolicibacterium parafortuitum]|uniref:DUF4304 domain-containing protein n=1 Tax=Mycolicibacterium parafortuitum TaxID=39692 RepID=A0A7I7U0R5_MYCPF|nr:DUF4304 domain-containing protein [Mycolicibacterium parafortuitum]BBY73976.1 hypothetical protein MPRF_08750 [Mycolicibacterium parafortuitum]
MIRGADRSALKRRYETMVADGVVPVLQSLGFVRSKNTFRRSRGPLYDVIEFQANWNNSVAPWYGFFVNVGVGSVEIDESCPGHSRNLHRPEEFLLDRRWEHLVPEAPYELRFDRSTDMSAFGKRLCENLGLVVAEVERISTTSELVDYAVTNNLLIAYEKTCCYLAASGDLGTLNAYVGKLRDRFGTQDRWEIFSDRISAVAGPYCR